jgi:hypothetical protein
MKDSAHATRMQATRRALANYDWSEDPPTVRKSRQFGSHQCSAVGNKGDLKSVALNGNRRGDPFADVTNSVSNLDII